MIRSFYYRLEQKESFRILVFWHRVNSPVCKACSTVFFACWTCDLCDWSGSALKWWKQKWCGNGVMVQVSIKLSILTLYFLGCEARKRLRVFCCCTWSGNKLNVLAFRSFVHGMAMSWGVVNINITSNKYITVLLSSSNFGRDLVCNTNLTHIIKYRKFVFLCYRLPISIRFTIDMAKSAPSAHIIFDAYSFH